MVLTLGNPCIISSGSSIIQLPSLWEKLTNLIHRALTIFWGFVILLILPDHPLRPGRWFTAEERTVLARRFAQNQAGASQQPIKPYQILEAVSDIKTWLYLLMAASIYICNGSVTAFGAKIITGLGYTSLQATALLVPGGAMTVITIAIFSYLADKYTNIRTLVS